MGSEAYLNTIAKSVHSSGAEIVAMDTSQWSKLL
jgi:hypothetical protein